jgi:hypothetical protein
MISDKVMDPMNGKKHNGPIFSFYSNINNIQSDDAKVRGYIKHVYVNHLYYQGLIEQLETRYQSQTLQTNSHLFDIHKQL